MTGSRPLTISKRLRRVTAWAVIAIAASSEIASASADTAGTGRDSVPGDSLEWLSHIMPNSEEETYLRYLQIAGAAPRYPWSLRGFSPIEARRLGLKVGTHPWTGAGPLTRTERTVALLPAAVALRGNSAFPYGGNDGPVWAGRGLTASVTLGVALRAGPLSLVLAPTAFVSQNASFDLLDNGETGELRFADGLYPRTVDRPQRFGDGAYGRVDPGNSTLRADIGPLAAGVSSANMAWGPSELHPFVLGTSAPGLLHGFIGTARPVNIWIGSLHGRVIWGRLHQSEQSPVEGSATYTSPSEGGTRRFASGLLLLFAPGKMPGLELGVARFFHSPWPRSGIPRSHFTMPFEGILKKGVKGSAEFEDPNTTADNQLLSGFIRWAFPGAGVEMYAEYGREDHSWDKRDFVQEPDHSRAYALGFRKNLRMRSGRMDGLTIELINFQLPHLVRNERGEEVVYVHGVLRQGHTNRGQLLGSDVGVGAASGSTVRWDAYYPAGRTTFALNRTVRQERGRFHLTGTVDKDSPDVQYALVAERLRRLHRIDITAGLALIRELNRDFGDDATALSGTLSLRVPLRD